LEGARECDLLCRVTRSAGTAVARIPGTVSPASASAGGVGFRSHWDNRTGCIPLVLSAPSLTKRSSSRFRRWGSQGFRRFPDPIPARYPEVRAEPIKPCCSASRSHRAIESTVSRAAANRVYLIRHCGTNFDERAVRSMCTLPAVPNPSTDRRSNTSPGSSVLTCGPTHVPRSGRSWV
jgi:hypothetical protein